MSRNPKSKCPQLIDRLQLLARLQLIRLLSSLISRIDEMSQRSILRSLAHIEDGSNKSLERHRLYIVPQNPWIHEEIAEGVVSESVSTEFLSNGFVGFTCTGSEVSREEAISKDQFQLW